MATDIVLRSVKAAALTHAEMDQNWESLAQTVDLITVDYTVLVADQNKILECFISSGTITLPTVLNAAGTDTDSFKVTVKNIHASNLIIAGNGSETIEGAASIVLLQNEVTELTLTSGAVEWNITGFYNPNLIGVTASATKINYNDISTLGTAEASKVMTTDASNNFNSTGTVQATQITGTTVNATTTLQINGTSVQTTLDEKLVKASNLSDLSNTTTARTNLNVDVAGTDNSTDVSLAGTGTHRSLSGQVLTIDKINLSGADVTGSLPNASVTGLGALALLDTLSQASDYTPGTWTPTLQTTTTTDATYVTQTGSYTKIGSIIFASFYIELLAVGTGTGSLYIGGLPFTVSSSGALSSLNMGLATSLSSSTAGYNITGLVESFAQMILLQSWDSTAGSTSMLWSNMTNFSRLRGSFWYLT